MKVLFDEDAPRPLRRHLPGHEIITVQEMGWAGVKNGQLLALMEQEEFQILLTFDRNLSSQQNLVNRRLAIVVVAVPKQMDVLLSFVPDILRALAQTQAGNVYEVSAPVIESPADDR